MDCFNILKACSQEVCPTVVSMVFDAEEMKVYWCENRQWDKVESKELYVDGGLRSEIALLNDN